MCCAVLGICRSIWNKFRFECCGRCSTTSPQTKRSGDFFRGGRYRTRTAAEATAACGGNREPRLGPRSDFSKPCQGAAEKSANATRTGASRQIPSRFPTRRNVYQERCRQTIRSEDFLFVVDGTGREQGGSDDASRQSKGLLQNSSLKKKIMHKTRNLFSAKTAQKWLRVSDFALFLCASCYRFFISGDLIFGYRLPCRARRGRNIPSG